MRILLARGDITEQAADAIVNAADSSLLGGGGVDGAIHRRGGVAILDECRALRASRYVDGLPAGQAVATTAGALNARWVIHTVGPRHGVDGGAELLASCYRESLRVADELGADRVAFPAVSVGSHGWPAADAARIAIRTVRSATTQVTQVRFVLFDDATHTVFRQVLATEEPNDDEIMAILAAVPDERWVDLFACAHALTDATVTWGGGQEIRPGVTQWPYPIYPDEVRRVIGLLPVPTFDWMHWPRPDTLDNVADALRLTTAIVRGERFSEGTIERALKEGTLTAIIDRLKAWHDRGR